MPYNTTMSITAKDKITQALSSKKEYPEALITTRNVTDASHNDGHIGVLKKSVNTSQKLHWHVDHRGRRVANVNMMQSKHRRLANISWEAS